MSLSEFHSWILPSLCCATAEKVTVEKNRRQLPELDNWLLALK